VLQKCRAFRRLPPNLRKLSELTKKWVVRRHPRTDDPNWGGGINEWYDDEGYELNPSTGERLTDKEIDDEWVRWTDKELDKFKVEDIPVPADGFADPDTWEEPEPEEEEEYEGPDESKLLSDIASHGRKYTARYYGISSEQLERVTSDKQLARIILDARGRPRPKIEHSLFPKFPPVLPADVPDVERHRADVRPPEGHVIFAPAKRLAPPLLALFLAALFAGCGAKDRPADDNPSVPGPSTERPSSDVPKDEPAGKSDAENRAEAAER
jgi:hypothetical protein